ncbi:hypothetical protein BASA81_008533 [Batrachochytrium salamandrivorans]|nr:hypothetical protein BASA81_008533 [Batrachochytrium salamandrivorans]
MLAHEFIRAAGGGGGAKPTTTVLFFHGLLGRKSNLRAFAKRSLPNDHCQALLVDMRGHGDSYRLSLPGTNTLESCARDVGNLVSELVKQGQLETRPSAVIGHSFGGKLALQYALTNPSDIDLCWVLDSAPGLITYHLNREDLNEQRESVMRLMGVLDTLPAFASKKEMSNMLLERNFSPMVANWMTTNVVTQSDGKLGWGFNLQVVKELFADYSKCNLVPALQANPHKHKINFLRAGRNKLLWTERVMGEMTSGIGNVFVLPNVGHFLHASDPDGVLAILKPSMDQWGEK